MLTIEVSFSGVLESDTAGSIVLGADYSCVGTECAGILGEGFSLPCSIEAGYTLTFEG